MYQEVIICGDATYYRTKKGLKSLAEIYADEDFKKVIKVAKTTFYDRVRRGWDWEKALITSPDAKAEVHARNRFKRAHGLM